MNSLHAVAVQAEKYLEKLCTGLAGVGASEQTVKACDQMAEVVRQIVSALGQGAENAPSESDQETPQEEKEAQEEADKGQSSSFGQAAGETHQMMQQAAAKRK